MSRIGRQPVVIPAGVTVEVAEATKLPLKALKVLSREFFRQR